MKIAKTPSWKGLSKSFKLCGRELTPGYEGYFSGQGPAPRVANYYPNIIRLMSEPDLESYDRTTLYSQMSFTESESILVLSLFWRSDLGSVLEEPLLRGIDHELYWHIYPKDLNWRPPENRISPTGMFSIPLCNPSYGAWRYPWLFEHFATTRYENDAREWLRAQKTPPELQYRYASIASWQFARCVPPRRDNGYFEPFEMAWQTYRDNYYKWLPTAPEWHRVYHDWGLLRANRCARWAVDGRWDDESLSPVEDYVARVGLHRRRVSPEEVIAATQEAMSHHGFLSDVGAPTLGRPDEWLDRRWAEEVSLGAAATRFLVRTNADFVDSDTANIHLEVVVADTTKGTTLVVWLPRPDGLYGRHLTAFNAHLRMVLRDVDDRLGGDTRCPLNVRKWSGNPVMEEYPVHKYRFSPSPTEQAPHVLRD